MLAHHLYLKNSTWQKSNAFCLLAISLPSSSRHYPYIHTYRNVCMCVYIYIYIRNRRLTPEIGTKFLFCFVFNPPGFFVVFFFRFPFSFFFFFFFLWFHHFGGNCSLLVPIPSEERRGVSSFSHQTIASAAACLKP